MSKTVLILEPNFSIARACRDMLRYAGHQVHHARSAQEAIERADQHLVDIVILEPDIAFQNGVNFLYEFVSYQDFASIPIIILTHVDKKKLQIPGDLKRVLNIRHVLDKRDLQPESFVQLIEQTHAVV